MPVSLSDKAYRMGCKTRRNSGFYSRRQEADTRNEHQDDDVSYTGHVRTALQERLLDEANRITQDA